MNIDQFIRSIANEVHVDVRRIKAERKRMMWIIREAKTAPERLRKLDALLAIAQFVPKADKDEHNRAALEKLEAMRWPQGAKCPHCDGADVYAMTTRGTNSRGEHGRWRCRPCNRMFTVRTKTPMEETRVPLTVWLVVLEAVREGTNANQVAARTGVTYKIAMTLMERAKTIQWVLPPAPLPQPPEPEVQP